MKKLKYIKTFESFKLNEGIGISELPVVIKSAPGQGLINYLKKELGDILVIDCTKLSWEGSDLYVSDLGDLIGIESVIVFDELDRVTRPILQEILDFTEEENQFIITIREETEDVKDFLKEAGITNILQFDGKELI